MAAELILTRADECLPLRREVLRPGRAPQESVYPLDDEERSAHFVVKQGREAVGAISLFHEPRAGLGSETWRIRGMAVVEDQRGQGFGAMLLKAAQALVEKRGGGAWANVRTSAEAFYARHGFSPLDGEVIDVEGTPHVVMTWHPAP